MVLTENNYSIYHDAVSELVPFYYWLHENSESNEEIAIVNDLGDFLSFLQTFVCRDLKKIPLGTEIPSEKCTQGLLAMLYAADVFYKIGEETIAKKINDFCFLFDENKVIKTINQVELNLN